jgi:N6-adenosine-specific RNA methylase IME4
VEALPVAEKELRVRQVDPKLLKPHPLAHLIPDMRASEWQDFYTDIGLRGIKVPLEVLGDGTVVDGRHRLKAALELAMKKVPVVDAPLNGDKPEVYMMKAAVLRRHLTDDQRAAIATLWKQEHKRQGQRTDLTLEQWHSEVDELQFEHHCSDLEPCQPNLAHYFLSLTPDQAEECIRAIFRANTCPPLDGRRGTEGLEVRWRLTTPQSRDAILLFRDKLQRCMCNTGVMVSLGGFTKIAKEEAVAHRPKIRLMTPADVIADLPRRRTHLYIQNNTLVVRRGYDTEEEAIQHFKVSRREIDKATKVLNTAPDLFEKVHIGEIALSNAYRQVKHKEEAQKIASTKPPQGTYQVIVVDPPWPFISRQDDPTHEIASPYKIKSIEEIKAFKVPAAEDSILWLWVPNTFLHDAFHVLEAWGLTYRTTLTWAKNSVGLGDWLGGQTEHCLLATKGNYRYLRNNESTLLEAPRTKHSEKPDKFYELVERLCPGEKIDMFARRKREGWTCWGAEING